MRSRLWLILPLATLSLLGGCAKQPPAAPAPAAKAAAPVQPSLSAEDVAAIRGQMHSLVDSKQAAGIVTLVVHDGKPIFEDAYGLADMEKGKAMQLDTVGAIASMTKPVTGVAMMILYEQGLWALDDPITKFVPEFANLKVMGEDGKLVAPAHTPTMRELMSHSAGFTYGVFDTKPVDLLYQKVNPIDPNSTLTKMIGKLAKLPLKSQPGTKWEYSVSVDIQGYILQKLSGMPYDVFVRERVLKPLKMNDTDFAVSGAARDRLAYPHAPDAAGELKPVLPPGGRDAVARKVPSLPSPGGALYSTVGDYARFAQMLVNGGELDGVRLLRPETVALMHQNALPEGVFVGFAGPKTGFGLDFAVAGDPINTGEPWPFGTYYWSGIFGSYFWIDPVNNLIVVGLIQRQWVPGSDPSGTLVARNAASKAIYTALKD
jgi:CubicO group peptidase (beta-lactamase class C family)